MVHQLDGLGTIYSFYYLHPVFEVVFFSKIDTNFLLEILCCMLSYLG